MSVNSQSFNSTHNFDVTVKSLLLGFTRPENMKIASCVNVVVFGTTEASASAYVANQLKAKTMSTIRCVGIDTKPHSLRGHGFSGYIVMLPELQYVGDSYVQKIIDLYEVLETANVGTLSDGDYKDSQILFANREIEAAFFGAMFERWKTNYGFQNKWHFDGEEPKYSLGVVCGSTNQEYLGYGDDADYKDADPDFRIAPPILLDLGKVVSELLVPGREHYQVSPTFHPIRFGKEFCTLSADQMHTALFKFQAVDTQGNKRTTCIHDDIAKKMFLSQIRTHVCVGSVYAMGECAISAPETVWLNVDDLAIDAKPLKERKKKPKVESRNIQIGDNGSIHTSGNVEIKTQ